MRLAAPGGVVRVAQCGQEAVALLGRLPGLLGSQAEPGNPGDIAHEAFQVIRFGDHALPSTAVR